MPLFIIYLIKANIALTLFFLAYRLVLRRLTFYQLNRIFLLFGIAFSALFPLIDFSSFVQRHQEFSSVVTTYSPNWKTLQVAAIQPETLTVWNVVEYVFFIGVAVMTIRLLMHFLSLIRIHARSHKECLQKEGIYHLSEKMNPFSFFQNIYLNPTLYNKEEIETIITHEKIHVKGMHSIDILIGEINNIFYWFNPGAWMMKTAIRENLEFIADQKILLAGMNPKQYQYSLLRSTTGLSKNQLTNHFNLFHLKNRIKMMNKSKSSKKHLLRYVILTPIVAVAIFAFTTSRGEESQKESPQTASTSQIKTISNSEQPKYIPPTVLKGDSVILPKGESEQFHADKSLKSHQKSDAHLPKDYTDFLKRNPLIKGVSWSTLSIETGKPTIAILRFKDGTEKKVHLTNPSEMKRVTDQYGNLPAAPTPPPGLRKKTTIKKVPNAQYIVDGQKVEESYFKENIKPEDIYSISVRHKPVIRVVFNKRLNRDSLQAIKSGLAKWDIQLDYNNLKFNKKGYLKAISFSVTFPDGFSGSASAGYLGKHTLFGFQRDYKKNATEPFRTGLLRH